MSIKKIVFYSKICSNNGCCITDMYHHSIRCEDVDRTWLVISRATLKITQIKITLRMLTYVQLKQKNSPLDLV